MKKIAIILFIVGYGFFIKAQKFNINVRDTVYFNYSQYVVVSKLKYTGFYQCDENSDSISKMYYLTKNNTLIVKNIWYSPKKIEKYFIANYWEREDYFKFKEENSVKKEL